MDNDLEDCSADFFRKISDLFERQNTGNPNFKKLYSTCRKNVIEFCNEMLSDLPSILASAVSEDKLSQIREIPARSLANQPGEGLARGLVKSVLRLIDVNTRANNTEVMDAWNKGPCRKILTTLREPEIDFGYYDFVSMCLLDTNETLKYCSEPIKEWVMIVDKCKRLNTLLPHIIENLNRERSHGENLWISTYKEIFDVKAALTPTMAEDELWLALMFLHSSAGQYTSINEANRKIVDTWYNALIDFHIEDCDADNLRKMSELHAEQNSRHNPNFELINKTFRKNLLKFCRARFKDLPDKMSNRMPDRSFVDFLLERPGGSASLSNQQLADKVAESVISTIESGRRGIAIVEAWKQGPCKHIRRFLRDPSMRQYSEFINMTLSMGRECQGYLPGNLEDWIRTVGMCRLLDELIPDLARDESRACNVRQEVRNLAGILQIGYSFPTPVPAVAASPLPDTTSSRASTSIPAPRRNTSARASSSIPAPGRNTSAGASSSMPAADFFPDLGPSGSCQSGSCRIEIIPSPPRHIYPVSSYTISSRTREPSYSREPSRRGVYNIATPTGRASKGYWDGEYWRYPKTNRKIPYMN